MKINNLIEAQNIYGKWYGDNPEEDIIVSYSMLAFSIVPSVKKEEIQERHKRIKEIIKRKDVELRKFEEKMVGDDISVEIMTSWGKLLSERASCDAIEKIFDFLGKIETL